jgi:hypothetical protein
MENIRIEEIGNINETYRNLEVFRNDAKEYFLYIGISDDRQLFFEIPWSLNKDITLTVEEWEHILNVAKDFLPKALADEDYYQNEYDK